MQGRKHVPKGMPIGEQDPNITGKVPPRKVKARKNRARPNRK